MKKFLFVFVVIVFIGTTILGNSFTIFAETPNAKLSLVPSTSGVKQDSVFTLDAVLHSAETETDIAAFGPIDIRFDPAKFEFVSLKANESAQADEMEYNIIGDIIRIMYLDNDGGSTPLKSNEALFTLSFKVKETPYLGLSNISILNAEGFADSSANSISVGYDGVLQLHILPKGSVNLDLKGNQSVKVGGTLAVEVNISNYDKINNGIAAFGPVAITFDSSRYVFLGAVALNGLEENEVSSSVSGDTIRILYVDEDGGNTPVSFSGAVISLSFKVKENSYTGKTSFRILATEGMIDSTLKPVTAFTGEPLTVDVTPKATVKLKVNYSKRMLFAGEEFSADLSIDSFADTNEGVAAFGPLDIGFDGEQFEFLGVTAQNEMKDSELSFSIQNNAVRLVYLDEDGGNTPLRAAGKICTLRFKVKDSATVSIEEFTCITAEGFISEGISGLTAEFDCSKRVIIAAKKSWTIKNNTISNFALMTIAGQVMGGFSLPQNARIEVKKTDGNILNAEETLGTGMIIRILLGDEVIAEYNAVIFGDVNGDGSVNSIDLLKVKRHILGLAALTDAYLEAANVDHDETVSVNSIDLLKIKRHILGLAMIQQA